MKRIILLASLSAFISNAYAMLQPQVPHGAMAAAAYQPLQPLMRYESGLVPERGSYTKTCITSLSNPDNTIVKAIEDGNVAAIENYFSTWQRFMMPWQDHDYELAETLKYAATHDPEHAKSVIAFLLTKVKPEYIEEPTCLLKEAELHKHTNLVNYLSIHFPELFADSNKRLTMADEPTPKYREATSDEMGKIVMAVVLCPMLVLTPLIACTSGQKEKEE